eukprot:1175905-Prorocentrum_minimum.AAC.3
MSLTHLLNQLNLVGLIGRLKQEVASSHRGATCVWTFKDAAYHRTGFTLAAPKPAPLCAAVVALVGAAVKCIDLRAHVATHPRLGVVDHISCHPLASTSTLASASEVKMRKKRTQRRLSTRTCTDVCETKRPDGR